LGRLRDNDAQVKALVDALTAVNKQLQPYAEAWAEVTDSIEILDGNAIVMFVNPAFATLTGRQSGVVGCPSPLQTPYGDGDGTVPDLLKRAREGQPWQAYLKVEVNGTDRNHEVHLTPILDDNGTLLRIIAIRSDVTEVRRAQAAVNYNERLVALGTLAAGLAHEINNPLTYIRTSLEMIAEQRAGLQDQPGSKQSVTDALDGVEIVARIVRDMLSLARSHEATAPRTPLGTVDLTEIVWATLNLLTPSTRGAVNIEVASQASPLTFHGRRHDAIQLILNLIRNAVQALETTPLQDSQISIRSGRDRANEIWLEIIDNGPGIDPTKLERIFEPFYTSKNVGKGAGLGLSTSRSLIADMGGSLDVSSRPGHTCFRATFVASKPEKQQPSSSEPSQSEDARILVIDDDPRVARGIKLMLRRHKVTLAEDGPTALTLVKNHVYDLIICDVMMPIMDGPTVYENIKSVDPRASEKLVFLTGAATSVDTRSALGRTGRQILAKPTNRRQLEQLVSEFHRPPPMSP
jgi:PAS domain S-box-containing protein